MDSATEFDVAVVGASVAGFTITVAVVLVAVAV
jgi:hypothetical protein